jgi:hypothetical protein
VLENVGLLGYDAVWIGKYFPSFWRRFLPLSSGPNKSKRSFWGVSNLKVDAAIY